MSAQGANVVLVNATNAAVTFYFNNQQGMDTSFPATVTVDANAQAPSFYVAAALTEATSVTVVVGGASATLTESSWAWWAHNVTGVVVNPPNSITQVTAIQQNGEGSQDLIYIVAA